MSLIDETIGNRRFNLVERDRAIKRDVIDRKTDHIKADMESLVRYIRSLLADPEPLDKLSIKRIVDAKLALAEAQGAILAIRLAESEHAKRQITVTA